MKKKKIRHYRHTFFWTLFHKPLLFLFLLIFLPFVIFGIQQSHQLTSFGKNTVVLKPLGNYGTIDPLEGYPSGDPPAENNPDLNLSIRGHVSTNGEKYPIDLSSGQMGEKTPQIGKMLDGRPTIVSLYRIYSWVGDFKTGRKGVPMPVPDDPAAGVKQVQMIGLQTSNGESIKVPPVYGNPISPEYNAMVIYADDNSITLKYTREDNIGIKNGYAIQIEEITVDPGLLGLYRSTNEGGRRELPAVSNEQVIGTAKASEIRVVIRDTGDFLDPRSKLDWWQGIDYPPVPTDVVENPTPTDTQIAEVTNPPKPTNPPVVNNPSPTIPPQIPTRVVINPRPTRPPNDIIIVPPTRSPPTPTPTPGQFIDIGKTVNDAKSFWDKIVSSVIKFTLVILP
ncbi:hypothetical protein HY029_01630 [Candidatus Gottesmanbacteria bacterium]|nr:hypothetical protein [Candidatus Gottesmanbacteria bacterium]